MASSTRLAAYTALVLLALPAAGAILYYTVVWGLLPQSHAVVELTAPLYPTGINYTHHATIHLGQGEYHIHIEAEAAMEICITAPNTTLHLTLSPGETAETTLWTPTGIAITASSRIEKPYQTRLGTIEVHRTWR